MLNCGPCGDFDYEQLDPGIRDVVRQLHAWEFHTCDSGDGVTKISDPEWKESLDAGQLIEFPHVIIEVVPLMLATEAQRLMLQLQELGIDLGNNGEGMFENKPNIACSYDPVDNKAFMVLCHVNNDVLAEAAAKKGVLL